MKNTSPNPLSFAYLDLALKFTPEGLETCTYDKRQDFGFPIVNFPDMSGCIPRSIARNVIASVPAVRTTEYGASYVHS